jgi:hypothetical protein
VHLSQPVYIKNNPELPQGFNFYRNEQMVALLNLFLRVQPQRLQRMFSQDNTHYRCTMFAGDCRGEDCRGEECRGVEVDGVFPFSANYYPLYGSI